MCVCVCVCTRANLSILHFLPQDTLQIDPWRIYFMTSLSQPKKPTYIMREMSNETV